MRRSVRMTSNSSSSSFWAPAEPLVAIHGVYLGPINWVERMVPPALPHLLKWWEPMDARVADLPLLRDLSCMFLVHAIR